MMNEWMINHMLYELESLSITELSNTVSIKDQEILMKTRILAVEGFWSSIYSLESASLTVRPTIEVSYSYPYLVYQYLI